MNNMQWDEYIQAMDKLRAEKINNAASKLTDRELKLVREAAVMGFVHGNMAEHGKIPSDRIVVAEVIYGCIQHSDLYPIIGGHDEDNV